MSFGPNSLINDNGSFRHCFTSGSFGAIICSLLFGAALCRGRLFLCSYEKRRCLKYASADGRKSGCESGLQPHGRQFFSGRGVISAFRLPQARQSAPGRFRKEPVHGLICAVVDLPNHNTRHDHALRTANSPSPFRCRRRPLRQLFQNFSELAKPRRSASQNRRGCSINHLELGGSGLL